MTSVAQDIDCITNATEDVKHTARSGSLRGALIVTLQTGKFMNAGTRKGQQSGFVFEDLLKLRTIKGNDGNTLLHYVALQLIKTVRIL